MAWFLTALLPAGLCAATMTAILYQVTLQNRFQCAQHGGQQGPTSPGCASMPVGRGWSRPYKPWSTLHLDSIAVARHGLAWHLRGVHTEAATARREAGLDQVPPLAARRVKPHHLDGHQHIARLIKEATIVTGAKALPPKKTSEAGQAPSCQCQPRVAPLSVVMTLADFAGDSAAKAVPVMS